MLVNVREEPFFDGFEFHLIGRSTRLARMARNDSIRSVAHGDRSVKAIAAGSTGSTPASETTAVRPFRPRCGE